jgi:hypothetical protein
VRVVTGSNPVAPTIPFFNITDNLAQLKEANLINPDRALVRTFSEKSP